MKVMSIDHTKIEEKHDTLMSEVFLHTSGERLTVKMYERNDYFEDSKVSGPYFMVEYVPSKKFVDWYWQAYPTGQFRALTFREGYIGKDDAELVYKSMLAAAYQEMGNHPEITIGAPVVQVEEK